VAYPVKRKAKPMSGTVATRMTFADLERLPESPYRQELLHGELIELPPPKKKHNISAERFYDRLRAVITEAHAKGEVSRLGEVHFAMGYRFEEDGWLIPDVSITHAGQPGEDYHLGSPALALEVISNEKTADYIAGKVEQFLKGGALEVWVAYPSRKHLWVYTPDGKCAMHSGAFASALLGGVTIDLDEILL
jgi:Uma2 family endonuclease